MPPRSAELIARRSALARGLVADRFADTRIAATGLRRMTALMDRLGNPQDQPRVIHVAGSKGKGTTTHIAADLLSAHGHRAGRFTSPHLHSWNERIAIDDVPISEDEFAVLLGRIDSEMSSLEHRHPEMGSYNAFELITAAALLHFAERTVDFATIEVGLGGRFDSTNVVHAAVSVITRIELEHEEILGPGLRTIAWNKAGIITTKAPVVVAHQEPDVLGVIGVQAAETGSKIHLEDRDWSLNSRNRGLTFQFRDIRQDELTFDLPGTHNRSNAGAALAAVSLAMGPDQLQPSLARRALAGTRVPGRFERMTAGRGQLWILDVAHTRESITRLLESVDADPALEGFAVMFALLDDKPAPAILETIASRTEFLILPDTHHPRAIPPDLLAEMAMRPGIETHVLPDAASAVVVATSLGRPLVVTGSFALVGQVRAALLENRDPIP